MIRFILRRLLQAVPTVFGVVLITFILFHVAGGSSASVVLGRHAAPRLLEDYEEARALNRPVLFGTRVRTRAMEDLDWRARPEGFAELAPGEALTLPLRFPVADDRRLEWRFELRADPETEWSFNGRPLPAAGDGWTRHAVRTAGATSAVLRARGGGGAVRRAAVRRVQENPFDSRFAHFLGRILRGDLGTSQAADAPVADVLKQGIGPSLALMIPIFTGTLLLSLCAALLCAATHGRLADRLIVTASVGMMSVNYIVWIVAGQYLFAYRLGWFPVWGFESWRYLLLPVCIGIVSGLGHDVRFYRMAMIEEMRKDYVRTARAKGLGSARILFRHVLPNAMIPVLTRVVVALPFLYTGSLLLESFFGIPGLGYLSVNAVHSADADVVQAVVLIGALLFVGANLLTDILYAVADPRVRLR